MIYLIGGAPRCGKSILAERLAQTKNISWLSIDTLEPMVSAYLSSEEKFKKFPFLSVEGSESLSPEESFNFQQIEARSMWPGIKAFIEQAATMKRDFILEGVHLLPHLVVELKKTPCWPELKIVYLVKKDLEKIVDGFKKNPSPFDWLSSSLNDNVLLRKIAKMVCLVSELNETEAKKFGFEVFVMDDRFEETMINLVENF